MKKSYVYMITRNDDLSYIGITVNKENRFYEHKRSERFSIGIKSIEILAECDDYEESEELEEYFISKYDTYKNGLNLTVNGKGKNPDCKFNTFGYKFSEKSREKMSASAKKRGPNTIGHKHDEESKKLWSDLRKGKNWAKSLKVNEEQCFEIMRVYESEELADNRKILEKIVKKSHLNIIGKVHYAELITKNGKNLNMKTICAQHFSELYGVSSAAIRAIIDNRGKRCEFA